MLQQGGQTRQFQSNTVHRQAGSGLNASAPVSRRCRVRTAGCKNPEPQTLNPNPAGCERLCCRAWGLTAWGSVFGVCQKSGLAGLQHFHTSPGLNQLRVARTASVGQHVYQSVQGATLGNILW